jgi:hypothetical protein
MRKQGSGCTVTLNSAVLPGDVIPRAELNKNAKPFCQVNDGKASNAFNGPSNRGDGSQDPGTPC